MAHKTLVQTRSSWIDKHQPGHGLHTLRGYLMAGIAIVTCPCHLPLTLPLVTTVMAGTILSVWLLDHPVIVLALSAIMFLSSLALGLYWLVQPAGYQTVNSPYRTNLRG